MFENTKIPGPVVTSHVESPLSKTVDQARGELEAVLSTTDSSRWWPRVGSMLERQRSLCRNLEELSRNQQLRVREQNAQGVLATLGERQILIDELVSISRALEPFRARKEMYVASLSAQERARFGEMVDEIARIVEDVQARDEHDRAELEKQRSVVTSELAGVFKARGAVAAYATAPTHSSPRFQDRQG